MKTNEFKITYPSGLVETVWSTDESVEALANTHFGTSLDVAREHGADIELLSAHAAHEEQAEEQVEEQAETPNNESGE